MTVQQFDEVLGQHGLGELKRDSVSTLQLNITKRCNLACHHCHVESSPRRTEAMAPPTVARILELLEASPAAQVVDLTGGAPEMHPQFRELVTEARRMGRGVIDRCNLTILDYPGYEDLAEFLASQQVRVIASLPCYSKENVERQRGRDVFEPSIQALQQLNRLGYGQANRDLVLDLVFNPQGAVLPGPQRELESDYRRELREGFGIEFDRLLTLTNMPVKRFAQHLQRTGEYEAYMSLLVNHFNPLAVPEVMCRSLVSVDYAGRLYDCDFNQQLDLPLGASPRTIWDVDSLDAVVGAPIASASHCFGCTAGAGSSCGGALVDSA